jgi:hypothetical protein
MKKIMILAVFFLISSSFLIYVGAASSVDINGGFEINRNGNTLPDFWEVNWRNGTSTGPYATIASYEPAEGNYHYRLFSGRGDAQSYMYAMSEAIPVKKEVPYKISAKMRYTLPVGDAQMSIIELGADKNNVYETHRVFSNGGWKWNDNSIWILPKPGTVSLIIRFGVGGEEAAYLDIDDVHMDEIDMNTGFESAGNHNGLPDFWGNFWWNGSSINASVGLAGYEPIDGKNELRLYNGTGDPNNAIYVLSDPIPVNWGSFYELSAFMKYTLPYGNAVMTVLEYDINDKIVRQSERLVNKGRWKWHYHSMLLEPKWPTSYVRIRFGIGGEEGAYLDLDQVNVKPIASPEKWQMDTPGQNQYFYDVNSRLNYQLLPDGRIMMLQYNKNGALIKKEVWK